LLAFEPKSPVESTIFDLWKELTPSGAFISGLSGYAGQMLVPDRARMENFVRKMDDASSKAETRAQQRLLGSLKAQVELGLNGEAQIVPDMVIEAFFTHIVKEGIISNHLVSLADYAARALSAYAASSPNKPCPTGIKILTSIRCAGVIEVANVVKKQTRSKHLQSALDGLVSAANDYSKSYK